MSSTSISTPFPVFNDREGMPLDNGFVFIGSENLDPVTNPITVYWDEALTIPAAQPIRTINGYPSRSGTPSNLFVGSKCSITVKDKNGVFVFSTPSYLGDTRIDLASTGPGKGTDMISYLAPFTGAVVKLLTAVIGDFPVSVTWFGAVGDGITDDTAAIQAAIDATPQGGTVRFPKPTLYYKFSTLTIVRSITFAGEGWFCKDHFNYAATNWDINTYPDQVVGCILKSTATSGSAINFGTANGNNLGLRDIAIIGPGTGTTVGIQLGGWSGSANYNTLHNRLTNVLVGNFATGISSSATFETESRSLLVRGCVTGWHMPDDGHVGITSDTHFYRCGFENCTTGVKLSLASAISFSGCLFQNNTTGLHLASAAGGGVESITVDGRSWFENTGDCSINIDSSLGSIKHIVFRDIRCGAGTIVFTGSNAVAYTMFESVYAGGVTLTIPSTANNTLISNSEFASVVDNTKRALTLDANFPRCIGWARFNGVAGTMSSANNMTLTKNGTGDYTLTLIDETSDGNYAVVASSRGNGIGTNVTDVYGQSGTQMTVRLLTPAGALIDSNEVNVAAFR